MEKVHGETPPVLRFHSLRKQTALRDFVALQDNVLVVLGPRRVPSVPCPAQNTNVSVSVFTSTGFQQIALDRYNDAVQMLCPDVAIALADIVESDRPSRKRTEKSIDRTHAWLRDTLAERGNDCEQSSVPPAALFASIPPIDEHTQSLYLNDLAEDFMPHISGIAISAPPTTLAIPPKCETLPCLSLSNPRTPHAILSAIFLGADLLTLHLINTCSEAGQAFTFTFPSPTPHSHSSTSKLPLAIDLWSPRYAKSISPISPSCHCYTCTRHHLAYIVHLLSAKEMLAWTLLQLHNYAAMDAFFCTIRASIAAGTFEQDTETFARTYEAEMPISTGTGPRVRGYHAKSMGGGEQPKRNPRAYGLLDEKAEEIRETEEVAGEGSASTGTGGVGELVEKMEETGFVEKA